jgi:phosphatidylglycerophosphate synthase
LVEFYLSYLIKSVLVFHESFYAWLNAAIRAFLEVSYIPEWFTANFITYARTLLVIPCLMLLAWGHHFLPSFIVLLVDFGDFLDGVVARYWVDKRKERETRDGTKKRCIGSVQDFDSSESPQDLTSWVADHRDRSYGGFVDAICDKVFIVPCWIFLLSTVESCGYFTSVQYTTLWSLICLEVASGTIRFKAFYSGTGVAAPRVEALNFSSSAVKADHIGKVKQTFEMVGSALFIQPAFRWLGLIFLTATIPLAYESVRRKVSDRVMYVEAKSDVVDYATAKFWKQTKGLGSKLIVGIPSKLIDADTVLNVSASDCVDNIRLNVPEKLTLKDMEEIGIDYVVCLASHSSIVTDAVIDANRCLVIGHDDVARPKTKGHKDE